MRRLKIENKKRKQENKKQLVAGGLVMKTNFKSHRGNNVQKAILKSLAVVTSLVLLSITVNAQVFWKTVLENNSLNHIAMAMIETKAEASAAAVKAESSLNAALLAEFSTVEAENPLELEEWMTNSNNFDAMAIEAERDNTLELESWMTNENVFNTKTLILETEAETTLELEGWMLENNFGGLSKTKIKVLLENYELEKDNKLTLEPWMVSNIF